uniref:Calcineurin-like phosphoesterase domain-containing protein n=1 Tax=Leptocylindrus danicus TaxID=163516 RepID=A0A7S2NTD1_9STRA|mmetsp:Transcript_11927/g.17988  ORF Transcript_11927/g.17988 Transcript_11927/m.17988 type:complete len:388 (+) Transcript_11927:233-1396(+)
MFQTPEKHKSDNYSSNAVNTKYSIIQDPNEAWRTMSTSQEFQSIPIASHITSHDITSYTRIVCISDTHGKHREVFIPKCDVLIHAGDFTNCGEARSTTDLANFFSEVMQEGKAKKIVCIAGNHEKSFDPGCNSQNWERFERKHKSTKLEDAINAKDYLKDHCTYLEDDSILHDNISFFGSPWSPSYGNYWAFGMDRHKIHAIWDQIPNETDVLITHGPPLGRGDLAKGRTRAGCVNLLEQIQGRIKPRLHVFGHIHEGYGCSYDGHTLYVNASSCTLKYHVENPCIVVDLPTDLKDPPILVSPRCTLSGTDVLIWLKQHGYDRIYPYFENRKPLLDGSAIMSHDMDLEHIISLLKMHSFKVPNQVASFRELRNELATAMMHLRSDSY